MDFQMESWDLEPGSYIHLVVSCFLIGKKDGAGEKILSRLKMPWYDTLGNNHIVKSTRNDK